MSAPLPLRAPLVQLQTRLQQAGVLRRSALKSFGEYALFVSCAALATVGALRAHHLLLTALLAVVASVFFTAAAMCGHDAAHGASCPQPWQNQLLGRLSFTLLSGMSLDFWTRKHNLHHAHPNVHGLDPDIEHGLFAYGAEQYERAPRPLRFLQRHVQGVMFWVLGSVFALWDIRVSSLRHLWRRRALTLELLVEVLWQVAHYLLAFAVPLLVLPPMTVLWIHLVGGTLCGVVLVTLLAPGHLADPLVANSDDAWSLQLQVCRNFRLPPGLRFLMNGLERQLEHHLAPNVSHLELRRAEPVFREVIREHGGEYREVSWARALLDTHRQLNGAWRQPAEPVRRRARESARRG